MEESSNKQQRRSRCPCGFWGSSKTLGLCSKCYREAERNQTQGNLHNADKCTLGNCHNQTRSKGAVGARMDSKHFPSHSTTDNLPSSLSGERSTLTAAAPQTPSAVDTTTPATSTNSAVQTHISSSMSSSGTGENNPSGMTDVSKPSPPQSSASLSDSDTMSSASSDQTYDPKRDSENCSSVSCSSLASVASSKTGSYPQCSSSVSTEIYTVPSDTLATGVSNPLSTGVVNAAASSNSQATSSAGTSTIACIESVGLAKSSTKDTSISVEKIEENAVISSPNSLGTQTVLARKMPVVGSEHNVQAVPEDNTSPQSPSSRGVKRSRDEMEASNEGNFPNELPVQKNKKRCFICNCKLELAQRTIGRCRCDRVFCALHRLPELHKCDFNHKEDGRREAREKMVVPTRHLGTSFRRDDHS